MTKRQKTVVEIISYIHKVMEYDKKLDKLQEEDKFWSKGYIEIAGTLQLLTEKEYTVNNFKRYLKGVIKNA